MSELRSPTEVIYFTSVLFRQDLIDKSSISSDLQKFFGEYVSFENHFFPMKSYYSKEMGSEEQLTRFFLVFPTKRDREFLISAKLFCDEMENRSLTDGARIINVDPGYISLDQMILATGKPYSHRVYLKEGVYAELTYRYHGQSFDSLDWTYPDYADQSIIHFFNWARNFLFF